MEPTFILLVGIGGLGLTLMSPYLGLLIYIGFLYLRPADIYPALAPYHVTRIMAIVLLISYFLHAQRQASRKIITVPQTKLILALMAIILLSAINGWWVYSLSAFYSMFKNFIAFYLIINLVTSEKRLRGVVWTLLLFNGILAWDALQQYLAIEGMGRIGGFSGGYFGGQGDFALMINILVPLALFLIWGERKILMKIAAVLCLGLLVGAVISTGSRGGGVITFLTIMMLFLFLGLRSPKVSMKVGSVLISVALIVGVFTFGSALFKARAASILNYKQEHTAYARIDMWKVGAKMFLDHPLLGVGAGMYPQLYTSYGGWAGKWRVSHNTYVTAASELGIGGILAYLGLLWFTLKDNWRSYRKYLGEGSSSWMSAMAGALLVSLCALVVGNMFQTVLHYPPPYLLVGLSVALKQLADREGTLAQSKHR